MVLMGQQVGGVDGVCCGMNVAVGGWACGWVDGLGGVGWFSLVGAGRRWGGGVGRYPLGLWWIHFKA